jgi:hypothetical protein
MYGRNWQRNLERRIGRQGWLAALAVALAAILGLLSLFGVRLPAPHPYQSAPISR